MNAKIFKTKEFAEMINVSVSTLRRWDRTGIFKANRRPSGRMFYTEEHLKKLNEMRT